MTASATGLAASCLVPLLLLASGCASDPSMPEMPEYTLDVRAEPAPPAAPAASVTPQDQRNAMRVPGPGADEIRVPGMNDQEDEIWPARGLWVGGALISSLPSDDFDGETAFAGPTDLVLAPDLDVGAGGGLYLGYRWHMNEILVMYSITEHDGDFSGSPRDHDTTFYDLDVNWRHYFWEHSPIQPYGLLGMGWGRATVDNGSTDQATGTVFQDAEFKDGISFNVGVGVSVYTLPWVMFYGQAMYRFVRYKSSDGIDGNFDNSPDLNADGWNVQAGAAIRLLPGRKSALSHPL